MARGKFLVLEGIDGSGKTTQAWFLARALLNLSKYNHVIFTREPYKQVEIRKILRQDDDPYSQAEKLAFLYAEDRKHHIKELIKPNLDNGIRVISDRYLVSTLVYQSTRGADFNKLLKMHSGLPVPDLIIIVDVPAKTAKKRMKKEARDEQKFEKNLEFMEKLRKKYLEMPKLLPGKIVIVNGNKSVEKVHQDIMKHVKELF